MLFGRLPLRFHEFGTLWTTGMRPPWIGTWLAAVGVLPLAGANQCRSV